MTDVNGKKVSLKLPAGKETDGVYANKRLQSRIDSASKGIIGLEVSKGVIKDVHAVGNMASGNAVETTIITVAGTTDFQYKTSASPDAEIFPGWTGKEGLKMINLSPQIKSYKGEKLSGGMKVGDVYYMIRNRANESTVLYLISRGMQKDLYFVKNYTKDAETGIYTFNMMYQGKAKTFTAEDDALATSLIGMANGAVLKLNGTKIVGVYDSSNSTDAYSAMVSNWDVSKISGTKLTLAMNIPTATTKVGETQEVDIAGAKIYNLSPNAGDSFGKTTKLQKGDRIRVYIDRNGEVSYVHVLVRGAARTALCPHCNKKVTWNPLLAGSDFTVGTAHYYVYDNMEITKRLNLTSGDVGKYEIILDLNGKTVTHIGDTDRMIMINLGNTLTILDTSEGETGVLQSYGYKGNGNVVQVTYGSTLNLLSGTLKHINAEGRVSVNMGGVIFSYSDANYDRNTINISGGKIVGGVVTHNSGGTSTGAIHAFKTDIVMTGGAIYGGTADRGGNVNLVDGSVFTMKGGELHGGVARALGGNIFANTGTVVNIEGGKVYGGSAVSGGGNIYAYGASINVTSGEVIDGSGSGNGKNIFLTSSSTLYLNNVAVSGGIYTAPNCGIMIEGDTKIGAEEGGVRFEEDGVLLVGQLTDTASVPVTAVGNFAKAAEGSNVDVEAYLNKQIVAADANCKLSVATDANGVKWIAAENQGGGTVEPETPTHKPIDNFAAIVEAAANQTFENVATVEAKCELCGETVTWIGLTNASLAAMDIPANGNLYLDAGTDTHYFLAEDIVMPKTPDGLPTHLATTPGSGAKICLHLNGKKLDQNNGESGVGAILVSYSSTMNIMGNGTVTGAGLAYEDPTLGFLLGGGAVDVRGTANILGGTYMSSRADRPTIACFGSAGDGPMVNMYGGKLVRNEALVTNTNSAVSSLVRMHHEMQTFNMYAGEIAGGWANRGGNLRLEGGTFNLIGGTIKDGNSANLGGNIHINGGTLNVSGGEILNGKTAASGGSIGVVGGALNVSGGTISGGTGKNAGLIYTAGGSLNITGGLLKDGVGTAAGGNIIIGGGTASITGGTITGGMLGTTKIDVNVSKGQTLTLGSATIGSYISVSGTVKVTNGAKASVYLTDTAKMVLADNLAEGTEINVGVPATQTVATHAKAAEYVAAGYIKTYINGATVTADGNNVVITVPAAS
jgi:hypothetical protein